MNIPTNTNTNLNSANRIPAAFAANPLQEVEFIGQLADLKEGHYQNSLLLSAMIELLIDKGVFTAQELAVKAQALDVSFTLHPADPSL
jgi:hypothetical protein